jgi:hypothetical protein
MAHGGKVLRFGLPGYRSFPLNGANCEPERFVYWHLMEVFVGVEFMLDDWFD